MSEHESIEESMRRTIEAVHRRAERAEIELARLKAKQAGKKKKKGWEIRRAWCWATGEPDCDKRKLLKSYTDIPGLIDLDQALLDGFEPLAYIPSSSLYGGYMLLRRHG